MNIAVPVLDRCTKLALMRAARTIDMTPTASRVLQFLIDEPGAAYWSLKRLAHAVRRQPRTVDFAIAELKSLGFITVLYRRRMTGAKVVLVDAVLTAVSRASALAKAAAVAAKSLFLRMRQASHKIERSISNVRLLGSKTEDWREQRPPSAALLRSMGLPVPPGRR
jgi:hypothetical protein